MTNKSLETQSHNLNCTPHELFDRFLQKTVIDKKPFLIDNNEDIFIEYNFYSIIESYINNPIGSEKEGAKKAHTANNNKDDMHVKAYNLFEQLKKNNPHKKKLDFFDKIKKQFEKAEPGVKSLFAHLMWLRYLPIYDMKLETKQYNIKESLSIKIENNYFPVGLASYSLANLQIDGEVAHLICLFSYLFKINNKTNNDIGNIKFLIINWIFNKDDCKTNFFNIIKSNDKWESRIDINSHLPIHNMLLHLCNYDYYEPIAIQNHKYNIVKNLYKEFTINNLPADYTQLNKVDKYIKDIKEKITNFKSFWDEPVVSKWKGGYVANSYEILTQYQKQLIIYGAPGTGKTYNAKELIKEFINTRNGTYIDLSDDELNNYKFKTISSENGYNLSDNLEDKNVIWDIVQFNQSFSYEDFIEGFRPQAADGLKLIDGIFKIMSNVAKKESNKLFILIIDEINRGKIDKIFGELLYLLEYRNESLKLHYSGEDFSIPDNLYIIGTMNTADKSIALLDVALRRRFWFLRCEPQESVLRNMFDINGDIKITNEDSPDNIKKLSIKLFRLLNDDEKGILKDLGDDASELKIGHSYFLKLIKKDYKEEDIEPLFSDLKNIWFYSIIPLLEEYCSFNKSMLSDLFKNKIGNEYDLSVSINFTLDKLAKFKW